jgi:predicted ATP-grasp superfamily ATP-dependent carboligase
MNVLVIHDYTSDLDCFLLERVLRCLSQTEHRAFVITADDPRYERIRFSRHYSKWMTCDIKALDAATINAYCRRRAISMVIPSDIDTTFLLSRLQGEITPARTFPLVSPESLAMLNNKWHFMQWLSEHGIPIPESQLLAPDASLEGLDLRFPLIAKPLDECGGRGVQKIKNIDDLRAYMRERQTLGSDPFLLQTFIEGDDLVFGIIAERGRVHAWTMQKYCADRSHAEFVEHPELLRFGEQIARELGHHGVAEFDIRLDAEGRPWFIECNPRLWASIFISLCMGVNYVDLGIKLAMGQPLPVIQPATGSYIWPNPAMLMLMRRKARLPDISAQTRYGILVLIADPLPQVYTWVSGLWSNVRKVAS